MTKANKSRSYIFNLPRCLFPCGFLPAANVPGKTPEHAEMHKNYIKRKVEWTRITIGFREQPACKGE